MWKRDQTFSITNKLLLTVPHLWWNTIQLLNDAFAHLFIHLYSTSFKNELECVYIKIGSIIVKKKPSSLKLTIKTMLQWYNFNGKLYKVAYATGLYV